MRKIGLRKVPLIWSLALAGCGARGIAGQTTAASLAADPPPSPIESAEVIVRDSQLNAWKPAYEALIERYRAIAADPYAFEDTERQGEYGVVEVAKYLGEGAMHEFGYVMEDLSGDGVPELAIGTLDGIIYSLYTFHDGQPLLVFEGGSRCVYVYMGSGHFFCDSSISADQSGKGIYILDEDGTGMECESFLFTGRDDNGDPAVFSNMSGSWDPSESEPAEMTVEDFWNLDSPGELLPLIPFAARNQCTENTEYPVSVLLVSETDPGNYYRITVDDGPDACELLFVTDWVVQEFTLWNLMMTDVQESGDVILTADRAISSEGEDISFQLVPEVPLCIQLVIPGDLPAYGISYRDDGNLYCFVIEISGEDGSLLMTRAELGEGRFILHPVG